MDETRLTVIDHPMVRHKLAMLRDEATTAKMFRELVGELTELEATEATKDLKLDDVQVKTPITTTTCQMVKTQKLAVVAILRAGIGMVEGMQRFLPMAHVGFLGMFRDSKTHKPIDYYAKLPSDIAESDVFLVDPMLATGGSAAHAIAQLRERGVKNIKLMVMVATPEGIAHVLERDPGVHIYTCALDEGLNEDAYIVPGLGDAGDRIFGTL